MGKTNFTEEFKLDATWQITERGHSVADVSQRLGVSARSLYAWIKRYAAAPGMTQKADQPSEIRRLKQELVRITEERDILKKPPRTSPGMQSEVRVYQGASYAVPHSDHVPDTPRPPQRVLCLAQKALQQKGR